LNKKQLILTLFGMWLFTILFGLLLVGLPMHNSLFIVGVVSSIDMIVLLVLIGFSLFEKAYDRLGD
jgi:hypothetical protein